MNLYHLSNKHSLIIFQNNPIQTRQKLMTIVDNATFQDSRAIRKKMPCLWLWQLWLVSPFLDNAMKESIEQCCIKGMFLFHSIFPQKSGKSNFTFSLQEDAKTRHFARKLVFAYFYYEFSSSLKLVLKIAQPYATLQISMNPQYFIYELLIGYCSD